jgi:hypothetical protein
MFKFFRKEDGLVTIEWVGIAAVVVLAGLAITVFVMQGADGASGRVEECLEATPVGSFGDGNNDGSPGPCVTTPGG